VRIHDLNSTNGTRVNGEPVSLSDLDANDEVTFGQQRFRIEFHGNRR
jgi:pSer/pThr/pTyr-binding forkhead associated (FHA) protein